jgi:type II secretory pathway component PulC
MNSKRYLKLAFAGLCVLAVALFFVLRTPQEAPLPKAEDGPVVRHPTAVAPRVADEPIGEGEDDNGPPRLRLVSVRYSDDPSQSVASIQDRATNIIHLLVESETMPDQEEEYATILIEHDYVVLETDDGRSMTLHLDAETPLTARQALTADQYRAVKETMVDLAERGKLFESMMMAQWRNVGLRERPHVLQQGSFAAYYGGVRGPDKKMVGLRAKRLTTGSIWDQMGIEVGDLLIEINGEPVDSMNAWRRVLQTAQDETDIAVVVQRGEEALAMRTRTIPPR